MFFKKIKSKILLSLILFIIPTTFFAYSDYLLVGGENIGIELNSNGIIIVGTYEVNKENPAKKAGLQNGDKIIAINDTKVESINDMLDIISKVEDKNNIEISYLRANKINKTSLELIKTEDSYKTGLYVKDSITGVGTLTYIDPKTKLFGALGHEIIEKTTGQKLEIKSGKIYNSTVTGIIRSDIGKPGEKNAHYDSNEVYGKVLENTSKGIFGTYTSVLPDKKLYKVANNDEVNTGAAKILTVIDEDNVEEFDINILKINDNNSVTKNILFEVTDDKLLKETSGIIQGMSGSPIVQEDLIVGAVTHVIVDDPTKGYGIFITKMLEESEN